MEAGPPWSMCLRRYCRMRINASTTATKPTREAVKAIGPTPSAQLLPEGLGDDLSLLVAADDVAPEVRSGAAGGVSRTPGISLNGEARVVPPPAGRGVGEIGSEPAAEVVVAGAGSKPELELGIGTMTTPAVPSEVASGWLVAVAPTRYSPGVKGWVFRMLRSSARQRICTAGPTTTGAPGVGAAAEKPHTPPRKSVVSVVHV